MCYITDRRHAHISLLTMFSFSVLLFESVTGGDPDSCNKDQPTFRMYKKTFKAAVYEHAVIIPKDVRKLVNRTKAIENMMKNINEYKKQAQEAGRQKVDILVFPEYGISGSGHTREGIESYLEYIPDPDAVLWNPCDEPNRYKNTEIQTELSCMAKNNSMYIVANMGDFQPCYVLTDPKCPSDGHFQFNTNVAFDSYGFLVAKYHKINLFSEYMFDSPPVAKASYFDTPFGRFGLIVCFDIIFAKPTKDLLENNGIGNFAFSTAWIDALPLLSAIQFHSAFAAGANVNVLAANINFPKLRLHGSGIYTPSGYKSYFYSDDSDSKLLISEIDIIRRRKEGNIPLPDFASMEYLKPNFEFKSKIYRDEYNLRPLSGLEGEIVVCHQKLCCRLYFKRDLDQGHEEHYAFGAYNGMHGDYGFYMQNCILIKCQSSTNCESYVKEANTYFKNIRISGNFKTRFIYPEILLFNKPTLALSAPKYWDYSDGTLQSTSGFEHPLIVANLLGRVYEQDKKNTNLDLFNT